MHAPNIIFNLVSSVQFAQDKDDPMRSLWIPVHQIALKQVHG